MTASKVRSRTPQKVSDTSNRGNTVNPVCGRMETCTTGENKCRDRSRGIVANCKLDYAACLVASSCA